MPGEVLSLARWLSLNKSRGHGAHVVRANKVPGVIPGGTSHGRRRAQHLYRQAALCPPAMGFALTAALRFLPDMISRTILVLRVVGLHEYGISRAAC
jgi:hypothetical protein